MAKQHDIVWHKKRGKFIPAAREKSTALPAEVSSEADEKRLTHKENFLKHLSLEARKAVRKT